MRIGLFVRLAHWLNLGVAATTTCPGLVASIPFALASPTWPILQTMSLVSVSSVLDESFDIVIFINDAINELGGSFASIENALTDYERVFSPTGKLDGDVDDSRNIYDAAVAGVKKAVAIGCKQPLLVLGPIASAPEDAAWTEGEFPLLNAVLGALHALYQPLEIREAFPHKQTKYTRLGVFGASESLLKVASAIEEGRRVARDIGGSDPERMAAPRIADYLQEEFHNCPNVAISITEVDPHAYPLMAAVDRATSASSTPDVRRPSAYKNLRFVQPRGTFDSDSACRHFLCCCRPLPSPSPDFPIWPEDESHPTAKLSYSLRGKWSRGLTDWQ
ncbi:unnamed protein product [Hydatigera taeniaeformis]|uniref:ANF_receptor domain-containing protein n=1 Tax=Hydatigena taeniaeformis TaxID=6205 RepID=A0A0R3WR63_HYDTA|nr:unnamed protein product [Hydatigera taeniaeformis]